MKHFSGQPEMMGIMLQMSMTRFQGSFSPLKCSWTDFNLIPIKSWYESDLKLEIYGLFFRNEVLQTNVDMSFAEQNFIKCEWIVKKN